MGTLSMGRKLLVRQVVLAGLFGALGAVALLAVRDVETQIRQLTVTDPATIDQASAILGATQTAFLEIAVATGVGALLVLLGFIPLSYLAIVRPMRTLALAAEAVAAGDTSVFVDSGARHDEIGRIAVALASLRDARALADATPHAAPEPVVADAHERAMVGKIEAFGRDLATQVQRLGSMTRRLTESADKMAIATRHANEGSDQATAASTNAVGDVSSVATASEQLLDSIEEISRQVVQSTNVVKAAVERAVETNSGMGRLSSAAQKVGDVVSLISRIAAQTNLLALNATIEAARAGEAGRGFAVVAQEVKTLATQTAKATQDITGQIAEMQQATDQSVGAIDKIQKKISEVEHISTIIAAAVHEQGAATQEIARNVRSAAAGTANMSTHIDNVVRSVGETNANAASIAGFARELDDIATGMSGLVTTFTEAMRAA